MKTVDLTPTPEAYRGMLLAVIQHGTDTENKKWAAEELARVRDVVAWGAQDGAQAG